MSSDVFEIRADGVDVAAVVARIQKAVDEKIAAGEYADARVAVAERANLAQLKNDEQFAGYYLQCLRDAVYVDISDFEIRERRAWLAPILIRLKRAIWSLLKFYTYRLWSQQNQVNGLLVTGLQSVDDKYAERLRALEVRVAELERRLGAAPPPRE